MKLWSICYSTSMETRQIPLDPRRKPVEEIAAWLCREEKDGGCLRTDAEGVRSLAHVLVVVPTAQSGRRLRLKLAERLGAVVPPEIRLPQQLLGIRDWGLGIGDWGLGIGDRECNVGM